MLEKTIKKVLNKKINDWIESIDNDDIKNVIKSNLIVCGGCFVSLINNETPNDFDCYFKTKEAAFKVAEFYVEKWNEKHKNQINRIGIETKVFVLDGANPSKEILDYYNINELSESKSVMISNCPEDRLKIIFPSDGIVGDLEAVRVDEELSIDRLEIIFEKNIESIDTIDSEKVIDEEPKKYAPVFISTNAITLSNNIQVIIRFYGEPDKIHETYDFEHTKSYYDFSDGVLSIPKSVYEAVINKTLIYTGSLYPVCSVFRMRKFIKRGYTINAGQMLKMCMQISELDLNNIDILEDQLIGVDSLYFMSLINQFKERQEKDPDFQIDSNYVVSIIDKIF